MGLIIFLVIIYIATRIGLFVANNGKTSRVQEFAFRISIFTGAFAVSIILF